MTLLNPAAFLLLQLLAILFLTPALAKPTQTARAAAYERNIFILDVSASMQTPDAAASHFSAAAGARSSSKPSTPRESS